MGSKGLGEDADYGEEEMRRMLNKYLRQPSAIVKILIFYAVFAAFDLGVSGCGYTTRSMISDKFKTIYIAPFTNSIDITNEMNVGNKYKIYRPYLETDITRRLISKFLLDGNLKIAKEESADLVLKGNLVEFRKDPLRYDEGDNAEEYRVNLIVDLSLWDKKEDKLAWEEKRFTGDSTYFTTGSSAKSEAAAINDAINDLVRRIVERTVEQW